MKITRTIILFVLIILAVALFPLWRANSSQDAKPNEEYEIRIPPIDVTTWEEITWCLGLCKGFKLCENCREKLIEIIKEEEVDEIVQGGRKRNNRFNMGEPSSPSPERDVIAR